MIHYVDREGERISHERWLELSRDPGYCTVLLTSKAGIIVVTSWVGLVSEREKIPGVFCTEVRKLQAPQQQDLVPLVWNDTEMGALFDHDELCKVHLF